jgi:hypothetical protein
MIIIMEIIIIITICMYICLYSNEDVLMINTLEGDCGLPSKENAWRGRTSKVAMPKCDSKKHEVSESI